MFTSVLERGALTHEQVSGEVERVVADDGDPVQGGDGQVLHPQQLLQEPDQSTEDAEVGGSAVGHQLVVALETHTGLEDEIK